MRYSLLLVLILLVPVIYAETFPKSSDVLISQPIRINGFPDSSIDANISVRNPLGNFTIKAGEMSYNSLTQEHEYLIYNGNHSMIGTYDYCITATSGNYNATECFSYDITQSGASRINTGESLIVFGGLLIMFFLGLFSFVIFTRAEHPVAKVTFLVAGSLFLFMSIMFSTILVQQNLGGFSSILSGYDTFVFVVTQITWIAMLAFGIFVFLFMVKAWKIRKGED